MRSGPLRQSEGEAESLDTLGSGHGQDVLIQAVYDVLPTPSNLFGWGTADTRAGILEHILSCCPNPLGVGRYSWRHNHGGTHAHHQRPESSTS